MLTTSIIKKSLSPDNHFDKLSPFERLFLYIRKNKFIPTFLASIKENPSEIEKTKHLLSAIQTGNPHAEIFSDKNCYLYLLYLLQENQVPFSQGMNIYFYLTALMNFTDKQPLRPGDEDLKFSQHPFSVDYWVENGELSSTGQKYIEGLCKKLKEIGYEINRENFINYVLKLPSSDQWLFKFSRLNHLRENTSHDYKLFSRILIGNLALAIEMEPPIKEYCYYWIPSVTIINYLLKVIFDNPIELQFVYGSVKEETLRKWHEKGKHLINLYAPHVQLIPSKTHGYRCGPIADWIHNIDHAFMGSMLTLSEREIIFSDILPFLDKISEVAYQYHDEELAKKIAEKINAVNDFDLSPVFLFTNKENRFISYIKRQLISNTPRDFHDGNTYKYDQNKKIGELLEDRWVFLILKFFSDIDKKNKKLWIKKKFWIKMLLNPYSENRNDTIVEALWILSKTNTLDHPEFNDTLLDNQDVNGKAWLEILDSSQESKILWEKIINERHEELLQLIIKYDFRIFHPYLPITEEKRMKLKDFFQKKSVFEKNSPENQELTPMNSSESTDSRNLYNGFYII